MDLHDCGEGKKTQPISFAARKVQGDLRENLLPLWLKNPVTEVIWGAVKSQIQ